MTSSTIFFLRRFTLCRRDAMQSGKTRHRVGSLILLLELGVIQLGMLYMRNLTAENFAGQLQVVEPVLDVDVLQRQRLHRCHDARNVEFLLEDSKS